MALSSVELRAFMMTAQKRDVSVEQCEDWIAEYEPLEAMRKGLPVHSTPRIVTRSSTEKKMGIEGFTRFLLGPENDFVDSYSVTQVYQDMTQPLTSYWISSSHNTYLADDQLKGPSDIDAYVRAFLMNCRCVVCAHCAIFDSADCARNSTAGTVTTASQSSTTATR